MTKGMFILILGAGFFLVMLPLLFYLNFRLLTMRCRAAGITMSPGQRVFRAVVPFWPGPKMPKVALGASDKKVALVLGIVGLALILAYVLAALGFITFFA